MSTVTEGELDAARRKVQENLRRVNQDYMVYGNVEITNAERLESSRKELARLESL